LDPLDVPRLDVLDEEFGECRRGSACAPPPERADHRRPEGSRMMMRKTSLRSPLLGRTRMDRCGSELQSAATASKSAQPAAAQEEIERLQGDLDALKNDVKELTEAQHQAAHTIATMRRPRRTCDAIVPPYW
jgi:hypothetical protein